ncbi:hypothetical protein AB0G29_36145 [Streptomyces parvus]|uniref:hypothetical protein n=1 Tax=Streptomyces parvus TaxID=66428 RepID=UPI0033D62A59
MNVASTADFALPGTEAKGKVSDKVTATVKFASKRPARGQGNATKASPPWTSTFRRTTGEVSFTGQERPFDHNAANGTAQILFETGKDASTATGPTGSAARQG